MVQDSWYILTIFFGFRLCPVPVLPAEVQRACSRKAYQVLSRTGCPYAKGQISRRKEASHSHAGITNNALFFRENKLEPWYILTGCFFSVQASSACEEGKHNCCINHLSSLISFTPESRPWAAYRWGSMSFTTPPCQCFSINFLFVSVILLQEPPLVRWPLQHQWRLILLALQVFRQGQH